MKLKSAKTFSKIRQQRGVAILVVLAAVVLLAGVVAALLSTASNVRKMDRSLADVVETSILADTAVNLATGMLRAGTEEEFDDGTPVPWTSQPGAVTTYGMDGRTRRVQKLYSAAQQTATTPEALKADAPANWQTTPGRFVDLNQPTLMLNSNGGPPDLRYPILDPRAHSLEAGKGVEGFDFTPDGSAGLPMPVAWLYLLKDGAIGSLDSAGRWTGQNSKPTVDNPMVGRVAFWTDDESCKVNLNTAGEAAFWDAPRADTKQERSLALRQPTRAEYHRQPGHPASVCLSSVLLPGQRHEPADFNRSADDGGPTPRYVSMQREDFTSLLTLGRHSSGIDPQGTSVGGLDRPSILLGQADYAGLLPLGPHASVDEALFSRVPTEAYYGVVRREARLFESHPHLVKGLARRHFFLTTQSAAPELTLFGTPRVALWPLHGSVGAGNGSGNSPVARASSYDAQMSQLATLGDRLYALARQFPADGMKEMTMALSGANQRLFSYLQSLSRSRIPGFYSADKGFGTFADKYGSTEQSSRGDMDTILLSMLDYLRSSNFSDGHLPKDTQFPVLCPGRHEGFGQVSPLRSGSSQGIGRLLTVSEVGLLVVCRAVVAPDRTIIGEPSPQNRSRLRTPGDREFDAAFLIEGFVPGHGWTDYLPYVSIRLGSAGGLSLNGQPLTPLGRQASATSSADPPKDWIAWGGSLGVRGLLEKVVQFQPVIVPAGRPDALVFSGTVGREPLLLKVYDDPSLAGAEDPLEDRVQQEIVLAFPDIGVREVSQVKLPSGPVAGRPASLAKRIESAKNGGSLLRGDDVLQTLTLAHGDYRLTRRQDSNAKEPAFVAHPQWGLSQQAHAFQEPSIKARASVLGLDATAADIGNAGKEGYIPGLPMAPGFLPDQPLRAWEAGVKCLSVEAGEIKSTPLIDLEDRGRRDGPVGSPRHRGRARPDLTGDFDNGYGPAPDGAYINRADDGNLRPLETGGIPYFPQATATPSLPPVSVDTFSAHRQIPSAVMFGSLPSAPNSQVPWQTLLFRPQDGHYGAKTPPDYLLLDWFWQPVVEPEPLSMGFETQGRININDTILPFSRISRRTALHAALKGETMMAVPDEDAAIYKNGQAPEARYRSFLNVEATLQLWDEYRERKGRNFLTAGEICQIPLVPESMKTQATLDTMRVFWEKHRLTGDNTKERPYAHIYPKLTTRSNVFRLHYRVETLQVAASADQGKYNAATHRTTGSQQGSCLLRRSLDLTDPNIPDYARDTLTAMKTPLTRYYRWERSGETVHQ
jgi:hypothetical protein